MKVFHVALFVLLGAVALCSAKSVSGEKKPSTGEHWRPPPVSVAQLNKASASLKEYFPVAEGWFHAINEELGKTKADADPVKGLEAFLHTMHQLYNVSAKAYEPFYGMLYSMMLSGFAWEHYNNNYQQMAEKWEELAKEGKFDEKLATEEMAEGFKKDIQGIRDEISWAKTEVINKIETLDPENPPHPIYVAKEIGAIIYVSEKIKHDAMTLVKTASECLQYMKIHARSNDVEETLASEVRSLMAELKTYQSSHTDNAKKALENLGLVR